MDSISKQQFFDGIHSLECAICFRITTSPIFSYRKGHILCRQCFENVQVFKLNKSSPGVLQSPSEKWDLTLPCKYFEAGCNESIKYDSMPEHLSVCEYRPIKCYNSLGNECHGRDCNITDFYQHLIDSHLAVLIEQDTSIDQPTFTLRSIMDIPKPFAPTNISDERLGNVPRKSVCFTHADRKFIFWRCILKGVLFCWVTILGGSKEADEFRYKISVFRNNVLHGKKENEIYCMFDLPVLPIHSNYNVEDVIRSGNCASIHWTGLKNCWKGNELEKVVEYSWLSKIEMISTLSDGPPVSTTISNYIGNGFIRTVLLFCVIWLYIWYYQEFPLSSAVRKHWK